MLVWGRIDSVSVEYRPELLVLIRYVAIVSGSLTWGLLQVVVVIGLFFVAPVIVVGGQIAFFQLVEKLGEVEADQGSFGARPTGAKNGTLAEPQRGGIVPASAIPMLMCGTCSQVAAPVVPFPQELRPRNEMSGEYFPYS
jgi:hypothetical protein